MVFLGLAGLLKCSTLNLKLCLNHNEDYLNLHFLVN